MSSQMQVSVKSTESESIDTADEGFPNLSIMSKKPNAELRKRNKSVSHSEETPTVRTDAESTQEPSERTSMLIQHEPPDQTNERIEQEAPDIEEETQQPVAPDGYLVSCLFQIMFSFFQ